MNNNNLFPVFLQLENLRLLIVGGGYIGFEKLETVLRNSPATPIKMVATFFREDVIALASHHTANIQLIEKAYDATDLNGIDVVIVAVNDIPLAEIIRADARERKLLLNVADKPSLCDFYLGSVVQKGSVKIAISTNGKSPTVAKRLKELLTDLLPDEMESLLNNMQAMRNQLKGDFTEKVKQLNEITELLLAKEPGANDN